MQENEAVQNRERLEKRFRTAGRIAQVVLFIILFIFLYGKVNTLLRNKGGMENLITFYDEPENSLDVIFAGTSHSLRAFYCLDMWERQGIASYNMSQNGQMMALTYYSIEEALRLQQPKVVVVDLYYALKDKKYGNDQFTHTTVDNLRWSPVKLKAILDGTKRSLWKEMFFPTIIYHSRWSNLSTKDFELTANMRRGSGLSYEIKAAAVPEMISADHAGGLPEVSREYVEKIVALCEKEGVQLVFTVVPYSVGNDNEDKTAAEQLAIYGELKELAAARGIPFLDYFEHLEELGLDFGTDFYDQSHLNALGAEKVSAYMADWLTENFDIPDRRGEEAYARWAEDYKRYVAQKRKLKTQQLPETTDMVGYFRFLKGESDYLVLLNLGGQKTGGLSDRAVEAMRACGIETDLRELDDECWVAVLDRGEAVWEERSPEKIQFSGDYEGLKVRLFSQKTGSYFNTIINGEKVGPNQPMLNVVVYSISQKKVVDSVAFDIGDEACPAVRP